MRSQGCKSPRRGQRAQGVPAELPSRAGDLGDIKAEDSRSTDSAVFWLKVGKARARGQGPLAKRDPRSLSEVWPRPTALRAPALSALRTPLSTLPTSRSRRLLSPPAWLRAAAAFPPVQDLGPFSSGPPACRSRCGSDCTAHTGARDAVWSPLRPCGCARARQTTPVCGRVLARCPRAGEEPSEGARITGRPWRAASLRQEVAVRRPGHREAPLSRLRPGGRQRGTTRVPLGLL